VVDSEQACSERKVICHLLSQYENACFWMPKTQNYTSYESANNVHIVQISVKSMTIVIWNDNSRDRSSFLFCRGISNFHLWYLQTPFCQHQHYVTLHLCNQLKLIASTDWLLPYKENATRCSRDRLSFYAPRDYHGNPHALLKDAFWLLVRLHLKSGSNFIGNDWHVGTITASKDILSQK
jgi:hypothetical protein